MTYPQYVEIDGKRYKINSDFRVAIQCNEIAMDDSIRDFERALAIIYKLYGEEGLNDFQNHEKLLDYAKKFLCCGEEKKETKEKPDMDYIEDEKYIKSSFKFDYNYDPYDKEYLHWYEFYNDLNNLSNNEFNCCILSRIRSLRNYDTSKIKDVKERKKIIEAKKSVALKRDKLSKKRTDEQMKNAIEFIEALRRE